MRSNRSTNRDAAHRYGRELDTPTSIFGETLMITVGMNYRVIPGKEMLFEDKFAAVLDALKAAPGHTQSTLWRDVTDASSYLITSEWSDEKAFVDFIHSQAFRDVTNWGKEEILAGRPQHKIYKN